MTDDTNPKDLLGIKKPPLELIPPTALVAEAVVFKLGAKKYGAYNWRTKKVRSMVYLGAALRHIATLIDGDDLDAESGQSHAAHARACLGIFIDAQQTGNLVDDRPPKGAAGRMIEANTEK